MTTQLQSEPTVYQGQFGEYTIDKSDRLGVKIYRGGLVLAAASFAIAGNLLFAKGEAALPFITPLFALFSLGLGISLLTIHIYLIPLHRTLQVFWGIGTVSAIVLSLQTNEPLALYVYEHPLTLLGVGFTFAALTGIYFKEAFCFNRLETKFLTPLVPLLLLGHMMGILTVDVEQVFLALWTILFTIFAVRKLIQPLDPDIGDKSVFDYLKQQKATTTKAT
ncbi:MAG: DUF2301 domain-containing membrane protein [Xenococcaceae cyanobacterium MO_188.B32]|nr:DUF2301 domain-containing membrane protein [Xenococcaceae cyanobacterium MO_188.B32]